MDNDKLDYLSNLYGLRDVDIKDSLSDLIRENYEFFKIYLKQLYHIESNFIYLNLVCRVSQVKIASLFGVSQYAVSKRIKGGLDKISVLLLKPETDLRRVYEDLGYILPGFQREVFYYYYILRTFSVVERVLCLDKGVVNFNVRLSMGKLLRLRECDNVRDFIVCLIDCKGYVVERFEDLESIDVLFYKKLLWLRSDVKNFDSMRLLVSRYWKYVDGLFSRYCYGDYTFKKWDNRRHVRGV